MPEVHNLLKKENYFVDLIGMKEKKLMGYVSISNQTRRFDFGCVKRNNFYG